MQATPSAKTYTDKQLEDSFCAAHPLSPQTTVEGNIIQHGAIDSRPS